MQVVHEQVGLDNKKSKPLKVVDDGKQEKLEPFRLEDEVKSPNETDQQPSDQEEEVAQEEEVESEEVESEVELQENTEEDNVSDKKPKKKKKNYQDRINELVKRANEAERDRNKLHSYNQELVSKIQTMKPDYQKTQQDLIETKKKNLEEGLKIARESHKSGDSDKLLEISEKIADIKYDMKSLDNESIKKVTTSDSDVERLTSNATNTSSGQVDPKALRWAQSNTWFGKDVAMTGAAYSIDAQLKQEGFDPSSDEYYSEVDRRMKDSFPHKFEEEKPKQVVAGVRRGTKNTPNKVRLSESQLAMAQRLGVPPEEYAKFVGSN